MSTHGVHIIMLENMGYTMCAPDKSFKANEASSNVFSDGSKAHVKFLQLSGLVYPDNYTFIILQY